MKCYFLRYLPNTVLKKIKKIMPHQADLIDSIRLDAFLNKTNFEELDICDWPVCEITDGEWDYQLLNVCFLENMLKNIVYCLANGYRPVVKFIHKGDNVNLWEQLFEQPYGMSSNACTKTAICDLKAAPIFFPAFVSKEDCFKYGKLYQAFVKPNFKFMNYFQKEYNMFIENRRVMGVLCRGTDYIATKPKGHPIQPRVEEVIALVTEKMKEFHCDAIYLATEEAIIQEKFEKAFPGKILVNERHYFDNYYQLQEKEKNVLISDVHFERNNDNYYKSIEYFSSIFLLSKCTALIAGSCGGSRAAFYLNNGLYEYSYLFNLGVY